MARDEISGWFAGRIPQGWFSGTPEVRVDREEIWVVGTLPDVELEVFAVNLRLASPLFETFQSGRARRQLGLEVFPLERHRSYLVLDLPYFLLAILEDE